MSDRIVTKRLETGEPAAFVRLRLENHGRSTARNAGVRVIQVHRWDAPSGEWARLRPELDGRLLQPSNQLASEPDLVDVFPRSDRIVDLASVDYGRVFSGASPVFVEISHPWPPNEANVLEPATWRLELAVVGDNITPERSSVTLSFDGMWHDLETPEIWDHFLVDTSSSESLRPPGDVHRDGAPAGARRRRRAAPAGPGP